MAEDVENYVMPVLHSGYIGEGNVSCIFEKCFGLFIDNKNAVVVNSGTSAITLALVLAGVRHGSRVISSPMTCLATNMAILSMGANIVWADILPDGTIDPKNVADILVDNEINAVVCMDWGGLPCKLKELHELTHEYNIPLIEDACQSIGSYYNNNHVGSDADYVAFSFQAIKHLTTGDGGALAINTGSDMIEKAKMLRWFGLDRTKGADMRCNQDPPVAGYKWQMNDIAASIGMANLVTLEARLELTRKHALEYNKAFDRISDYGRISGYWLYTIYMDDVEAFIIYMRDNGVECSRVHDRNDKKTIFKKFSTELPGVDYFDKHHVCIPVGWWLSDSDVQKIISLIKAFGWKR